ncbi:MAG: insulinase family protein [Myxococcota bacterium]
MIHGAALALLLDAATAAEPLRYHRPDAPAALEVRTVRLEDGHATASIRAALQDPALLADLGGCGTDPAPIDLEAVVRRARLHVAPRSSAPAAACLAARLEGVPVDGVRFRTPVHLDVRLPPPPPPDTALAVRPDIRAGTLRNGLQYYVAPRARAPCASAWWSAPAPPTTAATAWPTSSSTSSFRRDTGTTHPDATVYELHAPDDVARGVDQLAAWATGPHAAAERFEHDRAIVVEEWRRRQGLRPGPGGRWHALMAPAPLADSLPFGTDETLAQLTPDDVAAFVRQHYRPDAMVVVAVGDFDADAVVARIQQQFAALPRGEPPGDDPLAVPPASDPSYAVLAEPGLTYVRGRFLWRRVGRVWTGDHGDFRREQTRMVARWVAYQRLDALVRSGALSSAGFTTDVVGPGLAVDELWFTPEGDPVRAAAAVWTELRRLAVEGATAEEVDVGRDEVLSWVRGLPRTGASLTSELVRRARFGESVMPLAYEQDAREAMLEAITVADVDRALHELVETPGRTAVLELPADGAPTAAALQASLEAAAREPLPAPPRPAADDDGPLLDPPPPGEVAAREVVLPLDLHRFELANGRVVWWKRTRGSEVTLRAVAPGTALDEGPEDELAAEIVRRSGAGRWDADTLARRTWTAGVTFRTATTPSGAMLWGRATPGGLEAMLQLAHLRLTAPRAEPDGAARALDDALESLGDHTDPGVARDRVLDELRGQPTRAASLEQLTLSEALARYERRFVDAPWTFVLVGVLPPRDRLEALLAQWLGSLPRSPAAPCRPHRPCRRVPSSSGSRWRTSTRPPCRSSSTAPSATRPTARTSR